MGCVNKLMVETISKQTRAESVFYLSSFQLMEKKNTVCLQMTELCFHQHFHKSFKIHADFIH